MNLKGYCWLRSVEIPRNWSDICLDSCALDRGVALLCSGPEKSKKIEIGAGTYVNRQTIFDAHDSISVGKDVMIGPLCYITDSDHQMDRAHSVKSQPMQTSPVIIEDEVWIGAGVIVLRGVRIGRGAIVGAGSVVTRDLPPFSISVGTPAKLVRMRNCNE